MNDREVQDAQAIGDLLGLDITVQKAAAAGTFRLMVFDGVNLPRRISSYSVFTERFGTLDAVRAEHAKVAAELDMDDATAAALAASMRAVAEAFDGGQVAPESALPDTPNRVRHALRRAFEADSDPRGQQRLMKAMVDVEAFVPDDVVPAPGEPVDGDVLRDVIDGQTSAIVGITGVNGWRVKEGVPARIGQADRALRQAVANQAGYTASGVPAVLLGLATTGIVTLVAIVVALVSGTTLSAIAGAIAGSLIGAFAVLSPASRLAIAYAGADYLDRAQPGGGRAHRIMSIVWRLPAIGAVVGGVAGFAIAALLSR